jgi:hypothetical protein
MTLWIVPISSISHIFNLLKLPDNTILITRFGYILFIVIAAFIMMPRLKTQFYQTPRSIIFIFYLLLALIATLYGSIGGLPQWVGIALAYMLFRRLLPYIGPKDYADIIKSCVLMGTLIIVTYMARIGLSNVSILYSAESTHRFGSSLNLGTNAIAQYCIPVAIGAQIFSRRSLAITCTAIPLLVILITFSRAAVISVAAGIFIVHLCRGSLSRLKNPIILYITLGIGIVFVNFYGLKLELYINKFMFRERTSLEKLDMEQFSSNRLYIWQKTFHEILDHPIIGKGIGGGVLYHEKVRSTFSPHNGYLTTLLETGVPSLLVIIVLIYDSFKYLFKKLRSSKQLPIDKAAYSLMCGFLVAMLLYAIFESIFLNPTNLLGLCFMFSLFMTKNRPIIHLKNIPSQTTVSNGPFFSRPTSA